MLSACFDNTSIFCANMNDFDSLDERVVTSPVGRKRRVRKDGTKRAENKRKLYGGDGHVPHVSCDHNENWCLGGTLQPGEVVFCADRFYSTTVKTKQDAILLSYMNINKAKRSRVKDDRRKRQRTTSVKYFIVNEAQEKKPVCKETFMSIFGK